MKYLITIILSLLIPLVMSGCMMMNMMGGSDDKGHASGSMMKCGMMMGGMGMSKDGKKTKAAMKCGGDMKMDKNEHAVKGENRSKSEVITQKYCTQCHGFREKGLYSPDEWRPVLARMVSYMKKTGNNVPDAYESTMIDHYYGIN